MDEALELYEKYVEGYVNPWSPGLRDNTSGILAGMATVFSCLKPDMTDEQRQRYQRARMRVADIDTPVVNQAT